MEINRRQFGIISCLGLATPSLACLIKRYESNEAKLIKNLIENIEKAYVPKAINNFYMDPTLYRYGEIGIYAYGPHRDNVKYTKPVPTLCTAFETNLSLKYDIKKMDKLFGVNSPHSINRSERIGRSKEEVLYKLREMLKKA